MATKREDDRWGKRPPSTRCLYIIIALLICVIIAFVVLAIYFSKPKHAKPLCNTRQCLQSAYDTLFLLDPYKKPCNDFYEFACGDFKTYNSLPVGMDTWSAKDENRANMKKTLKGELVKAIDRSKDTKAVTKLKSAYEKCKTLSSISDENTLDFVNFMTAHSFPSWDTPLDNISPNMGEVEKLIAQLYAHAIPALLSVHVTRANDMQSQALLITPGTLSPNPNVTMDHPDVETAYAHLITKAFTQLKVKEPEQEAVAMVALEKQLSDYARSCPKNPNLMHITETSLQKMDSTSAIKWSKVFNEVFQILGVQGRPSNLKVKVTCDNYIQKIGSLFTTDPSKMRRYLAWRFYYGMMPYIDARSRHMIEVFRLQVNPPSVEGAEIPSAEDACIDIVNDWMPEAMTDMYLRAEMEEGSRAQVMKLAEDVKAMFLKVIPKQDWLDHSSKSKLEEKLKKLKIQLAHPDDFFNRNFLDNEYSQINIPEDTSFVQVAMDLLKHESSKIVSDLFQEKPDIAWPFSPLNMQSTTDYYHNTISIPIGLMEEPFYLSDRPTYLNFGGVAFLVAQEIFRGFTLKGLRFDQDGKERVPLPQSAIDKLTEKAQCFVEQYSKYRLEEDDDETLNGTLTLDTNLADNAAFYNTYQAFLEYEKSKGVESNVPGLNYTNHQLVFIQMAQSNCQIYNSRGWNTLMTSPIGPGKLRTNGMASNSKEFSTTFGCSSDSAMNPSKKCHIWTM